MTGIEATLAVAYQSLFLDHRYLLFFLLTVVEGPVVMTFAGFLLSLGYFELMPLYLVLMGGDLVADIVWYFVGYYAGRPFVTRYGKYFNLTETALAKADALFAKHQNKILFLSKITMGFGFSLVTLLAAGISRIPFRSYLFFNTAGQLVWTALLLAVGYFFGNLYQVFNTGLHRLAVFAGLVIVTVLLYQAGRYLRSRNFR